MQVQELQLPVEDLQELTPVLPNRALSYLAMKRLGDCLISSLLLVILSPIFLIIALAIKLEDPKGKVIYKQLRAGGEGLPFWMYKFRSMYSNADEMKALLKDQNEMDGPVFKIRNDPRITKVGRIIRRLSLDEIPQFVHVWRGQLSLVGPRPLYVEEAEELNPFQKQRELVKPGLTCIWQVSGRSNIPFKRWMEMDIEYIQKQSLWTDFVIILKTVPAVFFGKGAA